MCICPIQASFSLEQLREAGVRVGDLAKIRSAEQLLEAGFPGSDLRQAGFKPSKLVEIGKTVHELQQFGERMPAHGRSFRTRAPVLSSNQHRLWEFEWRSTHTL